MGRNAHDPSRSWSGERISSCGVLQHIEQANLSVVVTSMYAVVIATGLSLPTSMTFGPDGNLYVANVGFGPPPIGLGQILRSLCRSN
jgi:hypothetical protein